MLGGAPINLLLYADGKILLSEYEHDLQRHFNALDDFCTKRGLVLNPRKIKVRIFHTSACSGKFPMPPKHSLIDIVKIR